MKILMYINSMDPAGGIERVVSRHIHYFAENNNVYLLTKDSGVSFYSLPDNIYHEALDYSSHLDMTSISHRIIQITRQFLILRRNIIKQIQKHKPDIIYCCYIVNIFELFLCGIKLKKILVTEHGSFFAYNRIYCIIKRFLYPKCLRIIAPTTLDYGIYRNWAANARYIPNPLPFTQDEKAKLENKIVLTIGRLTNDKQHSRLLDIWKMVTKEITGWKLRIIGEGENKETLLQKIRDLSLEDSVEILPPTKNIITEYINASVFALTSCWEGFGMVLAEAMECGLPCIAFDCPSGPRDIISNDIDGFLVEPFNTEMYAEKLVQLIKDKNLRMVMGCAAAVNIQKFSESIVKEQWKNLIKEL